MNNDYQNFVKRMGSCEMTLDLSNNPDDKPIVTRNRSAVLEHHGIPGMKWGHRKNMADTVSKASKTGQDMTTLGQKITRSGTNKKFVNESRHMSDEDLKKITTRLNLENNYVNAKNQQAGHGKVENVLSIMGSTLAVASSAAALYSTVKKG